MIPETHYARHDGLHLAYQVLGDGPPDILFLDQWFGHLEAQWDVAPLAELRERLASFGRLIMYDKRGSGLSDPLAPNQLPTVEEWMDDIPIVLDAVGAEKAVVVANIGGGIMAMTYAAAHPERVASLVLVDCFARFSATDDYAFGAPIEDIPRTLESIDTLMGRGLMLTLFAPSEATDDRLVRAWARYERQAASPGMTAATVHLIYESDVREVLPAIRVPTLVIHRAEATGFRVEHGRYLAAHIPGAVYVELPGVDNLIWAGDQDAVVDEIQQFVTGTRPAPTPRRALATVLFTDIVDSTRIAAERGDVAWRRLLAEHDAIAHRQVERAGGRVVKTTGDGLLATFDGPARGINCAIEIVERVREIGIEIRAGIHTGECERIESKFGGLAVTIGSRVASHAGPSQVLVSQTVKDLVAGSGLLFEDAGEHELKGVPGPWHLYSVLT